MLKVLLKIVFNGLFGIILISNYCFSQIVINEIGPANVSVIQNTNGLYDDWLELYNPGNSVVNLLGYSLSDEIVEPDKFVFPSVDIQPGEKLVVFGGKKSHIAINHYEMAVNGNGSFKFYCENQPTDTNWRNLSFNENSWRTGNGGIGFNDGDDATEIDNVGTLLMRKTFTIDDTSDILNAIFMMDYDDGYVAYINGIEISKANMPVYTNRPPWEALALVTHEAQMSLGFGPDSVFLSKELLRSVLRPGVNVLAVETHDYSTVPTDMSSKPFLFLGMSGSSNTFPPPPTWFISNPQYYTAEFKLSSTGETIYLMNPSDAVIDQITYPRVSANNSFGRFPDGDAVWKYFEIPTPGLTNNNSVSFPGYAYAPIFFLPAGYYNSNQIINISTAQAGGEIRYTTNGDEPTQQSNLYVSPVLLDSTTTIRARVFSQGYLPGPIITNTYFIDEDPRLPVFCITTDSLNLWDENTGIYTLGPNASSAHPFFGANYWQDWTKRANIEFFDRTRNRILSFDADIEIYGNYSRSKPQKSFEIKLEDHYGTDEVNYPLIADKPYITKYDRMVLRNAGTDCNIVHFRDALMQRLMKNTHSGYVASEPVKVFLNGSQWGVYQLCEKHNKNWIENNYDVDPDDISFLEEIGSEIVTNLGNDKAFWELYDFATSEPVTSEHYYKEIDRMLDLKNYTDYFIAQTYYNNGDWLGEWTNNIKIWRENTENAKLRYILIDTDYGFGLKGDVYDNRLGMARNPIAHSNSAQIFDALLDNDIFKRDFINRYADLINTIYQPDHVKEVMKQFRDSMAHDMIEHFNKWDRDTVYWNNKIESMMTFVSQRPQIMRDYIQSEFNLSGQVLLTLNVFPQGAGRIEISTVVPDSLPWSGIYFHGNPVTITAIPNPGYSFDHWSSANTIIANDFNKRTTYDFAAHDNITAFFTGSAQTPLLTVSEFNYNSSPEYPVEDWIELHNYGNFDLDISGWKLKDSKEHSKYEFPTGTVIPAWAYLVIPEDSVKFAELFPSVSNRIGQFNFSLKNGGDQIRIADYKNSGILNITYEDDNPWPEDPDGYGFTCELVSPWANMSDGNNWFAGCFGGSPGRGYDNTLSTRVRILGDSVICSEGSALLRTDPITEYQYQWLFENQELSGAVYDSLTTNQSGHYALKINSRGCSLTTSPYNLRHAENSPVPVISNASRCEPGAVMLVALSDDKVYWYDGPNGKLIFEGDTMITGFLEESTKYYTLAGPECPSDFVTVNVTIGEEACSGLNIFPNPSLSETVTLQADELEEGEATLIISDSRGSIISNSIVEISTIGSCPMPQLELNDGIYIFTLYQDEKLFNSKFIKIKL